MKNVILVVIAAISLSGCASVSETSAPDGRKAYALNCSGSARGWNKCLQAAGEKCGSAGYDVLDRSTDSSVSVFSSGNGGLLGGNNDKSMLIACKVRK